MRPDIVPSGLVQLRRETQIGYCRLVTVSTDNLIVAA
jgi:hypothetical protein